LQKLTAVVHTASEQYGLKINTTKTKTIKIGKKETVVKISVEQIDGFTYLGTLITKDGSCGENIRRRIAKESAVVSRFGKIWRDKNVSVATKLQLYEALVVSVSMYWLSSCGDRSTNVQPFVQYSVE